MLHAHVVHLKHYSTNSMKSRNSRSSGKICEMKQEAVEAGYKFDPIIRPDRQLRQRQGQPFQQHNEPRSSVLFCIMEIAQLSVPCTEGSVDQPWAHCGVILHEFICIHQHPSDFGIVHSELSKRCAARNAHCGSSCTERLGPVALQKALMRWHPG